MGFLHRLGRIAFAPGGGDRSDSSEVYQKPGKYYIYLCLSSFYHPETDIGKFVIDLLGQLDQETKSKIIIRYPSRGHEPRFREQLLENIDPLGRNPLYGSQIFMIIIDKPIENWSADWDGIGFLDIEGPFLNQDSVDMKALRGAIGKLAKIIDADQNVFKVFSQEDKRYGWTDAIDAKIGVAGFSLDLKKLFKTVV